MAIFVVGRVCRKTSGRDAGRYCVITGKAGKGFAVAGPGIREKGVSGSHLEPTPWVVSGKDPAKELAELKLA